MKTIGYIVCDDDNGGVLVLSNGEDGSVILEHADEEAALLFGTRAAAESAVSRSEAYARERGWKWTFRIVAVVK